MKKLVIYFSHTGENYMKNGIENIEKGNTEVVAENISHLTGADLFKVEPLKEYPYNYHECCNVAKEELENNSRPKIKNKLESVFHLLFYLLVQTNQHIFLVHLWVNQLLSYTL